MEELRKAKLEALNASIIKLVAKHGYKHDAASDLSRNHGNLVLINDRTEGVVHLKSMDDRVFIHPGELTGEPDPEDWDARAEVFRLLESADLGHDVIGDPAGHPYIRLAESNEPSRSFICYGLFPSRGMNDHLVQVRLTLSAVERIKRRMRRVRRFKGTKDCDLLSMDFYDFTIMAFESSVVDDIEGFEEAHEDLSTGLEETEFDVAGLITDEEKHVRIDSAQMVVQTDMVYWRYYEKHCDEAYETGYLHYDDIDKLVTILRSIDIGRPKCQDNQSA